MLNKITKIILLITITLSITGCNSSYKNLNDIGIVSSFLVDKNNNEYKVYIELYKEEKSDNKSEKKSYFITGNGKNLRQAILNASNSESKQLYFNHINAVIFSKDAIDNNLEYMFNYLEKRIQVNSNYYILITDNIKELTKSKNDDNPILGEKIKNLINNSTNEGTMLDYDYLEKLHNFVSKDQDILLNKLEIKDDKLNIKNGYYFSNEKIVNEVNDEEIKLLNLFNNKENIYFNFDYNTNNYYVLKIDNVDIKYDFKNSINIKLDIKANIDSAGSNIDLNELDTIKKLNNHSSASIKRRLNELLNKFKDNNSDILGINSRIYKYTGYKKYNFFKDRTNIEVNLTINKKGLVNNTIGGEHE